MCGFFLRLRRTKPEVKPPNDRVNTYAPHSPSSVFSFAVCLSVSFVTSHFHFPYLHLAYRGRCVLHGCRYTKRRTSFLFPFAFCSSHVPLWSRWGCCKLCFSFPQGAQEGIRCEQKPFVSSSSLFPFFTHFFLFKAALDEPRAFAVVQVYVAVMPIALSHFLSRLPLTFLLLPVHARVLANSCALGCPLGATRGGVAPFHFFLSTTPI